MATATSLTAETIEEMMGGWVQVSVVQETQAALLSTFEAILATNTENLQNFEDVVLPSVQQELADSAISIANLTDNQIPALQVQLDGHDEELTQLNDVVIPDLQAGLNSNFAWIEELNTVTLPAWQLEMDANNAAVNELNTVTLPAMQTQLDENTAAIAAIDISGLQTDLDAAEAAINTLNTVTIPGLESDISTNAGAINTLNTVTIPGLASDLDAAEASINTLNTTTLPGLDSRLDAAEADVSTLEGKFPITGPDIAANAVTANKIAANTITANEIATNAITADEIAADAVTANELAANAVTAVKINAGAVVAGKIAADAVTATTIAAGAVVAGKIAADAVTATEIAANAVTATEIAADAVIAAKIQAGAVVAGKIAADAVTATTIAAGAVVAGKIAADAVTANEIAANAVTATEIAANAVIAGKINANAVTATTIAAGAVVAGKIAADAVTANEIAANAVTATEIAAGAVIAGKIAADAVTANEIAANAVTATEIAAGAVTALKIAALTITGDKIAADTIAVTKLIVSDLTNLVVDGDLADPTSATWFEMGANSITRVKTTDNPPYLQNKNIFSLDYIYFRNENIFEIKAGDEFYVSLEAQTAAGNTSDIELYPSIAVYDVNGANQLWRGVEEGPTVIPPNSAWIPVTGTIKITESSLAQAQFNPYGKVLTASASGTQTVRIRKINLRRKNTGRLIVDGSIEGKNLKAGTVTADQIDTATLTGDLFVGEVIFGGLMRAGDLDDDGLIVGGYSEMGSRGIFTIDDAGDPVFTAPTSSSDGAYLKAHLDLLSADVRDNFTMHGTNNSIATEAELTLSAGVEAPSVPPVLQQVWDQVQFNKTTAVPPHTPNSGYNLGTFAFNPSQVTSIAWDSTWSNWTVIQQKSNGFRVWRFNGDGSIQNNFGSGRPWVDDWNDRLNAHCCYNDDKNGLATIFLQGDQWYIWDPQYINKIPNSWIIDAASRPPALTYDTINNQYCLVQNNGGGSGTIHVRRFTVSSAANFPNAVSVSTNSFEAGSGLSQRINGAIFGDQLGVANSWTINTNEYQTVYTFNGSGVMYNDDGSYRNWLKPGSSLGMAHNGTSFASIDSAGVLTFYTNWTWLQSDGYVWIGASAADTDAGGTGIHETPVGTMKSISLYRRSKLKITMPETNDSGGADDPDKWRLYFKRGSNVAPTDKTLLKLIGDIGSPTTSTSIIISADATGGNPVGGIKGQPTAVNNFPGADPGRIESAGLLAADSLPILQMLGSGAGRWGTLTVDTNGNAVIGGDTGWISVTPSSPWTNYGSPYGTLAYRKIGNRVHLKGMVKGVGGTTGSGNPIMTLPVGCRPSAQLILAAIGAEREANFAATGDNPAAFTTGTANSHTHSANPPQMDVQTLVTFSNTAQRLDITTGGLVFHATGSTGATGTNWISLEGISFLVD